MKYFHTAAQQRKVKTGTKYLFESVGTFPCNLQPLSSEESQTYGLTFTQSSKCYVPIETDVTDGDRLEINGTTFGVRGVSVYSFGNLAHKKLVLESLSV